jgi:hypothetical protein
MPTASMSDFVGMGFTPVIDRGLVSSSASPLGRDGASIAPMQPIENI